VTEARPTRDAVAVAAAGGARVPTSLAAFFAKLAALPGVLAVKLGGSRARAAERPDSDWDLGLYYRGSARPVDPDDLRALGQPGHVVAIGEWGPLMNGGAWLAVDGQRVDVLYRDLDVVESRLAEAEQGRFEILHVPGYLAGAPSYLLLAELALGRVLHGTELPRPEFPGTLRVAAARRWRAEARFSLDYADLYAQREARAECLAMLVRASLAAAHARLADRGEWATNEKRLLERAGLVAPGEALAISPLEAACAETRSRLALGPPEWAGALDATPRRGPDEA
jgi:hypothetical protein